MGSEHQINCLINHVLKVFQQIINRIITNKAYRNDQLGIIQRYYNEGNNWNEHLINSKNYILNALPAKTLNSIAILGSGWLLDVPVNELLDKTEQLFLIDIYHPKQIVNKYKNQKRVRFVKADLTNDKVNALIKSKTLTEFNAFMSDIQPISFLNEYDFVVSLNLLNQLDILLCDLIKHKFNVPDEHLIEIREKIQNNHLKSLPTGKSCIITDYVEINYIEKDKPISECNLIYTDINNLTNMHEWEWNFDTRKTYRQKMNSYFKVMAGKY